MVGRTQFGEDLESLTVSELVFSLKSAFQHSYFSRVEQVLVSREDRLNKEIEEKHKENQLLLEKFLSFQKECGELREERDELLKRLKENQEDDDKRQNCELKKKNSDENSSQSHAAADNRSPLLSENIVQIIDSDGESASPESAKGQKRKLASSVDVDEGRPIGHKKKLASSVDVEVSKILTEIDSWSSSSSDEEVDLSHD